MHLALHLRHYGFGRRNLVHILITSMCNKTLLAKLLLCLLNGSLLQICISWRNQVITHSIVISHYRFVIHFIPSFLFKLIRMYSSIRLGKTMKTLFHDKLWLWFMNITYCTLVVTFWGECVLMCFAILKIESIRQINQYISGLWMIYKLVQLILRSPIEVLRIQKYK